MEKASIDVGLLEPILLEYRDQKGAVIPILQRAQDLYGYLPEEVMIEIAKKKQDLDQPALWYRYFLCSI